MTEMESLPSEPSTPAPCYGAEANDYVVVGSTNLNQDEKRQYEESVSEGTLIEGNSHELIDLIQYHIYKPSLLKSIEIIKSSDKSKTLYTLTSSKSIFSSYSQTLRSENSPTVPLFTIQKGNFGFSSTDIKLIHHSTSYSKVLLTTGKFIPSSSFQPENCKKFTWSILENQSSSIGRGESLICKDEKNGLIAKWERNSLALSKSGQFSIKKGNWNDCWFEILLGTALAVEEWRKEQAGSFKADY